LSPRLPPPPIEGPDVSLAKKDLAAKQAESAGGPGAAMFRDRKGGRWALSNQGRVHHLMAAHSMVKLEKIYGSIFQGILGEQISTKPVEVVPPFPWVRRGGIAPAGGKSGG